MNLFEQFTISHPSPHQLQIRRHPGLLFGLFVLLYFSFVTGMNALFVAMFLDLESPQTLTCRSQRQIVDCEYRTFGPLSGKTVQILDVRSAIASQKPNGETIVLTTSQPWVALQATDDNSQNIVRINQALNQLRQRDQIWQLEMAAPSGMSASVVVFFGPIGLLFLGLGLAMLLGHGSATFEFDASRNAITITKLGVLRSHLAAWDQLVGADSKPLGYLGVLSDRFGIYGGDEDYRRHGHKLVRLLFTARRPHRLTQTSRSDQAMQLALSINDFIAEQRRYGNHP